ncbi:hypothetical protein CC80DRAFT_451585 [Byssothecium circinans]|uniref:RTA1 like protein n=1 Tax=Byssothecium circinans TaxID=147558 RepID=A0A6A5TKV9_9PLEO|nr:hypothetical protein CC80DRAFT_451585 [Byssothecium circinans]
MAGYNAYASVFYLVAFAILLPIQLSIGLQRKTHAFLAAVVLGLTFEILAYIARILVSNGNDQVAVYLVSITIAPTFISVAMSLCLPRIIHVYGKELSPLPPRLYETITMLAHSVVLGLQIIGGGVTATHNLSSGAKLLQAGSAVHFATLTIVVGFAGAFFRNMHPRTPLCTDIYSGPQRSTTFRVFLIVLAISTTTIMIRTCYRAVKPKAGIDAVDEKVFFVLDGAMVLFACLALTIIHPGVAFRGHRGQSGERVEETHATKVVEDREE